MKEYEEFLRSKTNQGADHGFDPVFMPGGLKDFQKAMVEWSVRKGRCAMFEDCGMGKTFQSLVWAQNVAQHTNKPVLILTPLAVAQQTVREGAIFTAISIVRSYVVRRAFNRFTFVGNYGYNSRMEHFDSSVIDSIGGNAKVAELCHVSSQAVSKWRREGIPQARRQFLELAFPEAFAEREEQKAA